MVGQFPQTRLRRQRRFPWLRELVRETTLSPSDLVLPVFIREPEAKAAIPSMPGLQRYTLDEIRAVAAKALALGIPALALFPVISPALKTKGGEEALNPNNLLCSALALLKKEFPQLGLVADVALDPFTSHGHDGILNTSGDDVDNDATLAILAQQALIQAQAGADILAPSDMMDGRIGFIRQYLDHAGFQNTALLSYAAKYASSLYGPFRDALGAAKLQGPLDKRTYQMDGGNGKEALREVALDLEEGADFVMVKPGLPFLDVIYQITEAFAVPVFGYQVSGEYAMIHAAAAGGSLEFLPVLKECLLSMKRAGACAIFTYGALEVAESL